MKDTIDTLKELQWGTKVTPVEIVGTTFGNMLQNRILNNLVINNVLLFYLVTFVTFRYLLGGN